MKMLKKGLTIALAGLVGLTLASCNQETRNQSVPYGSISDTNIASALTYNVTQKEFYDRLKYSYGYTVFTNKLNHIVYADEYAAFSYAGDDKISIDESVASAVYSSSDVDTLRQLTTDEITDYQNRYIDSMALQGLQVTKEQITFDAINNETEHVSFSHLSDEMVDFYSSSLVIEDANIEYLKSIADSEFLPDEDNPEIENENTYYIDDKALENEYNDGYRDYFTAHGVVLRFNSLAEANRYIALAQVDGSLASYIRLYNLYYSYKEPLTTDTITTNSDTTFVANADDDTLNDFSSDLKSFFVDTLEAGSGLTIPRNIGGTYYLIYKHDLIYTASNTTETIDYSDLNTLGEDRENEIKQDLRNSILESNASSVNSQVFTDRILNLDLKIYDPFIENTFANSYTDYEYVTTFNNSYVFETNSVSYTVEEFYSDLTKYNPNETLVTLLLNKYLYDKYYFYLDDDDESDLRDSIDSNIKSFNNGDTNLSSLYGESNYLFYNYGYYDYEAVVLNNLASTILTAYTADYIYDAWANTDHTLNTDNLNVLENLLNKALAIYGTDSYLDLNVDHILISVDNDGDGSPDDLDTFLNNLSETEKQEFIDAVNTLALTILKEATAIDDHTNMDKLTYIVDAFNRNKPTYDGHTWDEYKTYNFILTAESLGDVTNSNVSDYVEPFGNYLEAMYDKAVEDALEIPEDDDNGRFYSPNGEFTVDTFKGISLTDTESTSDLCQTNYGYHMISLNSYDEESINTLDFKYTSENDTDGDYAEIEVILNENDPDDDNDNIYVVTDTYGEETDKPSMKQVFVYYVQYTQGDVTGFRTSLENDLSDLLDDVIAKYQVADFQEYLLIRELGSITTPNSDLVGNFNYDFYLNYLVNQIEDYDTENITTYSDWYNNSLNWSRHDF